MRTEKESYEPCCIERMLEFAVAPSIDFLMLTCLPSALRDSPSTPRHFEAGPTTILVCAHGWAGRERERERERESERERERERGEGEEGGR